MYQPNRDTHVPTIIILSQNTYIFLQLNIDKYVPTQQIYTRTLRLLHVQTTEHRHILRPTDKLLCTNPTNTHMYQSEHRSLHTPKHGLICTNQTETHTYQQIL